MYAVKEPTQVTFLAAEVGNFEFLSVVMSTYPDLIWELNTLGQSIIHVAALHRHSSIFNLIHEIGPTKDFVLTYMDDEGNTLLHCVAKLAPQERLNIFSGAALQMMLELSWFEEVKKIMLPSFIELANHEGITPRELFIKDHQELLKKGESWMKRTANSCMVVATLIATGVLSAAFSLGANNDNLAFPNYLTMKPWFMVFALSDALALVSSSTSILIFLSILISRYAEEDFLKSLPLKLIFGLVALFISIISMMVSFSSAFYKKDPPVLKLTKRMWEIFLTLDDSEFMYAVKEPTQVTFLAAEVGNFEFLSVVMSTYPDLIWELNTLGQKRGRSRSAVRRCSSPSTAVRRRSPLSVTLVNLGFGAPCQARPNPINSGVVRVSTRSDASFLSPVLSSTYYSRVALCSSEPPHFATALFVGAS
ncbi:uncharacterized protein LOC109791780 [Cajanus cajan]|uniref:uncharacterized protein LOC109791780 n=1 Tax=Cajanus cajan TaxID=3821 RepID=UPI00098D916E|nr:uncharacterized protein LOC109791780 [Cajanus cajan]